MRTYLLINNSARTALKKSQRILAKYLPQLGPTTYIGPLSTEALNELQTELAAARSRYLSVACYTVPHDLSPELLFIVGSKTGFDLESGLFAHRTRTLKPDLPYFPGTPTSKLVQASIRLAALLHDLGKMSEAFQAKLWRAIRKKPGAAEFIRHDAMSYLIVKQLTASGLTALNTLPSLSPADLAALVAQPSASALKQHFGSLLNADLKSIQTAMRNGKAIPSKEQLIQSLVAFLMLTHHRLPGLGRQAKRSTYAFAESMTEAAYFNMSLEPEYQDCLRFKGNIFQENAALAEQLTHAVDALQDAMHELPDDISLSDVTNLTLFHARPILVLSDRLGSAMKSYEAIPDGALLGNTRPGKAPEDWLPGDTLATHIRNVVYHARRQTQFALTLVANEETALPQLSMGGQRNIALKRSPTGRFAWQHEAHDHLKTQHRGQPAFVSVTAGTGSGKTIASAQIMQALGSTRFTYALGLRSLTLQTGASYQKDLGLMKADLAVVIGDQVARKVFELQDKPVSIPGSESLDEDELIVMAEDAPEAWQEIFKDAHGKTSVKQALKRTAEFIASPVVVCTVDQLIGVTQFNTLKKAYHFRRLQSADLILDEIDNYSPAELKHLSALCYLAGLSRKHVVCLSATMGLLHFEALFEAWQAGLRLNGVLTGLGDETFMANISNVSAPRSLACRDLESARTHAAAFNEETIAALETLPTKVKLDVLPCHALDYPAIIEGALRLHAQNHNDCEGLKVSAGFIRMSTVRHARKLAKHLFETTALPADTAMAVVCYHAKYSGLELSLLDRRLNTLANRKPCTPGQGFSEAALKELIKPLAKAHPEARNLLLVVVASSIIETGRDHDYDWAIIEPNSHRSLIQAAGRIQRHREHVATAPNALLIETPAKAVDPRTGCIRALSPLTLYSRPGPFTPLVTKEKPGITTADWAHTVIQAQKALHNAQLITPDIEQDATARGFIAPYAAGVRNAAALLPPAQMTNSLAIMEQKVLHDALLADSKGALLRKPYDEVAAREMRVNGLWLTDWAFQASFRGTESDEARRIYLMPPRDAARTPMKLRTFPVNAAGDEANVRPEKLTPVAASRCLLLAPYLDDARGVSGLVQKAMEDELAALIASGLTAAELSHLSGYTPATWSEGAVDTFYHALLGYNDKNAS